jgi:DNA adenine methylase
LPATSIQQHPKIRPFLKWPGGKYRLIEKISTLLPAGKQLIEPFLGSGAVFLNTHYDKYLLNDANPDLITLYQILQTEGKSFIDECRSFFTPKNNTEKQYYRFRKQFNDSNDPLERSFLFLYLNRHGYNGLCRYNAKKGEFNVPFGRYTKPYFPKEEMQLFYQKSKKATFVCEDFTLTLKRARAGSIVYCDPPYIPLSKTAGFTTYRAGGFSLEEQHQLALLSTKLAAKGIPVLLSNHSNPFTRSMYRGAKITQFDVQRFISCKSKRESVLELLALYLPLIG